MVNLEPYFTLSFGEQYQRVWVLETEHESWLEIEMGYTQSLSRLCPAIQRAEKDCDWYIYPQFLAHENHKIAHKNAQKSFINFKPRIGNVALTGTNFAPPPPKISLLYV